MFLPRRLYFNLAILGHLATVACASPLAAAGCIADRLLEQNLFYRPNPRDAAEAEFLNRQELRALEALPASRPAPDHSDTVTFEQAQKISDTLTQSEITGPCGASKFDPAGVIGFCFGRAFAAHVELRAQRVGNQNIRKIWAMGSMDGTFEGEWAPYSMKYWSYHVVTAVRAREGGWWVIDPALKTPLRPETWLEKMKLRDRTGGEMRIFLTEPKRVFPDVSRQYKKGSVYDGPYFNEYLQEFRERLRHKR